jgi:hypothetical protein
MTPKNLKSWDFVKDKKYDISRIKEPEGYYYQLNNGIYYPAVDVFTVHTTPEPAARKIRSLTYNG